MGFIHSAPCDPIFFMHHANIDRLWSQWQAANPGKNPNLPGPSPGPNSPQMDPWAYNLNWTPARPRGLAMKIKESLVRLSGLWLAASTCFRERFGSGSNAGIARSTSQRIAIVAESELPPREI